MHVTAEMPRVQTMVDHDGAIVGGFSVNPERPNEVAVVGVIDNLRKGAAGQALQNLNLALGCDEALGLDPIWNSKNPFPWIDEFTQGSMIEVNFFEGTVREYQTGTLEW